jgi:demethylmenaquinone methyltransferase/2-methoxy-6-polyprenyl-1,4-benzoquinol methylase
MDHAALSDRKEHALWLFQGLPRWYDQVGAVMSFGQDPRWRRALVRAVDPRSGQRILDVASGTGMVAFALVDSAPGCEVVGVDQSEAMLGIARERNQRHHHGVRFERGQAEHLPFPDATFDALSFTYLLRYVDDPAATMRELARVVKPGGRIGMLEFGVPARHRLRALWRIHTRVGLPLIGRLISRAWYEVGRFLGPNIEQFHTAHPHLERLFNDAGITSVVIRNMSFGAGLVMWGVRDGDPAG